MKNLPSNQSEILLKALFLESKYTILLKEITAQKSLFKTPLDFWTIFFKITQYQLVCQRI
jgi:hypothetical protein